MCKKIIRTELVHWCWEDWWWVVILETTQEVWILLLGLHNQDLSSDFVKRSPSPVPLRCRVGLAYNTDCSTQDSAQWLSAASITKRHFPFLPKRGVCASSEQHGSMAPLGRDWEGDSALTSCTFGDIHHGLYCHSSLMVASPTLWLSFFIQEPFQYSRAWPQTQHCAGPRV